MMEAIASPIRKGASDELESSLEYLLFASIHKEPLYKKIGESPSKNGVTLWNPLNCPVQRDSVRECRVELAVYFANAA